MKTIRTISLLLLSFAFVATGCRKEGINTNPVVTTDPENVGYLSFANWQLAVAVDQDSSTHENDLTDELTRAENVDNYLITVKNAGGEVVHSDTYANTKSIEGGLALQPGAYTVTAASDNHAALLHPDWRPDWNEATNTPSYHGSAEFTIRRTETTEVKNLTCRMANIKVEVNLSPDLNALFLPNGATTEDGTHELVMTVTVNGDDEHSLKFHRDGGETGYFKATSATNTLTVSLSGHYNMADGASEPDHQARSWSQEIQNVKAGEYRQVTIKMEHANDGNVQLQLTVATWTYDRPWEVDVMRFSSLYEPGEKELDEDAPPVDPGDGPDTSNGPVFVWTGTDSVEMDFSIRHTLWGGMNEDGSDFPVKVNLYSATSITDLTVDIVSDLLTSDVLDGMDLALNMNLVNPATEEMNTMLRTMGFPTRGQVTESEGPVFFDISRFMPMLYSNATGESNFVLTATDAAGVTSQTIMILVPAH